MKRFEIERHRLHVSDWDLDRVHAPPLMSRRRDRRPSRMALADVDLTDHAALRRARAARDVRAASPRGPGPLAGREATAAASGRSPATTTSRAVAQGLAHVLLRARRQLAPGPRARGARGAQVDARHGSAAAQQAAGDRQPRLHPARRAHLQRADQRALRRDPRRGAGEGRGRLRRRRRRRAPDAGLRRDARSSRERPSLPGRARRPDARPGRSRVRDRSRGR